MWWYVSVVVLCKGWRCYVRVSGTVCSGSVMVVAVPSLCIG